MPISAAGACRGRLWFSRTGRDAPRIGALRGNRPRILSSPFFPSENNMKRLMPALGLTLALPLTAHADDGQWKGTGEVGIAASRGNAKSENVNAKLNFSMEDDTWKNQFFASALRNKGEVKSTRNVDGETVESKSFQLTANRYELGASAGYKFDERSYLVGAARYENDDFSPFDYQAVLSLGYGYTAYRTDAAQLSFEIGPGYKHLQPIHGGDSQSEAVGRGLVAYKQKLTANTAFEDTFLVEAGSANTFYQNDANLAVSMNSRLALKLGYQVRRNSEVSDGVKKTDQQLTTNLVYNF